MAEENFSGGRRGFGELGLTWLRRDPLPRAIVDQDLRLLWSNAAADAQLDQRRDLEVRNGMLATTDPRYQADFSSTVRGCGEELTTFHLNSENGHGELLFRAHKIGGDEESSFFGIAFFRSGSDFKPQYADVEKVFQLTQSEHRVLELLTDGLTADQAAELLGVSVETTRSHIRRIYAKLDVSSREALFSRINAFRI